MDVIDITDDDIAIEIIQIIGIVIDILRELSIIFGIIASSCLNITWKIDIFEIIIFLQRFA